MPMVPGLRRDDNQDILEKNIGGVAELSEFVSVLILSCRSAVAFETEEK